MKKTWLLLLLPILFAFQCEEDDVNAGFEIRYVIQNDSGTDLYYLDAGSNFIEFPEGNSLIIGTSLSTETEPIPPSESLIFESIRLFEQVNGDYLQRYVQDPLDDSLWLLDESVENRFEYTFLVTPQRLN